MIITAVEAVERRRSRVRVYVDGVAACDVARTTAAARGLAVGQAIDVEGVRALVAEDQRRGATETAAAMLARRPRSERDVRRRLAGRKFPCEIIDAVVGRLLEARLIDDEEYARGFADARARSSPRSRRLVVQELRSAGVSAATAAEAVAELDDGEAAYRLAASRLRGLGALEEAQFRARLSGLLQRRGFGWGVVRATVERCWRESRVEGGGEDTA